IDSDYRGRRSKTNYNYFEMVAEKRFEVSALVWAKRKNLPFWPARIALPPTVLEKDFHSTKGLQKKKSSTPRKAQHYVLFFGTKEYAWVLDENIVPHSVEMLCNVSRKKSTSYVKAIDEIIAAGGVIAPNLKLVKKELSESNASTKNSIDEVVESTKMKIKVEKTDEPNKVDELSKQFIEVWNTETVKDYSTTLKKIKIEKTEEPVQDDDDTPLVVFVRRSARLMQKIKVEKTEQPSENEESYGAIWNLETIIKPRAKSGTKLHEKSPASVFEKRSTIPKPKIKVEKTEEPVKEDECAQQTVDFSKMSTTLTQKMQYPVQDIESSNKFTALLSPGKNTMTGGIKDDKLIKKSTFRSVKNGRTPKEKIKCGEAKKPSQKRDLTEEACDKKLYPVRKLSRKSDDNSASIFNTRSNTDNPIGVFRPLDDPSMFGQKYVEPSPVPVLDMSRPNPIMKLKNICPTSKKLGFVGLGTMGQRIVKNLLESGHDVSVWNRTREKCAQFVEAGARHFLKPCDIVLNCDIIFSCVAGPEATKSVFYAKNGILQGFENCRSGTKGLVVLSAMDLDTSIEIAVSVTSNGGNYLEAPISGSITNAEQGSLLITVAGNLELFSACFTSFNAIAIDAYYVGKKIGSAQILNMAISMVKSTAVAALAEGMSLAERMNLSKNDLKKIFDLSPMSCRLIAEKGLAIATNNFTTDHSLKYQQSNLRMILELSHKYTQPMLLASAANEVYKKAKRLQYSDHDMSAVYFGTKD
ncbi:putative oxidoreductase GLYR1, partial [Trichonephila clavata]